MKQLKESFYSSEITLVCHTVNGGGCEVVSFPNAKPLECCYKHFYVMHPNDIFNRFWCEKLSQVAKEKKALSFQQVVDNVWKPVFDQCVKLLGELKSGKLKLSDVDSLFKESYSSDQNSLNSLRQDLCNLHVAIHNNQSSDDFERIESVVCHIGQYWNLCNYHEAAKAFIKIRDMLNLTGDFTLVEEVIRRVFNDQKMIKLILFFRHHHLLESKHWTLLIIKV